MGTLVFVVALAIFDVLASGQEVKRGCKTEDGRVAEVGEQVDVPGHCNFHRCMGNDEWVTGACGAVGLPHGWSATPEDTSGKTKYPDCCVKLIGPQDIVPDILDTLPGTGYLEVIYGENITADVGNELTPTQVKAEPVVKYTQADPSSYYLLIMTDPDAPSRQNPESREFLHWMVGNIPGGDVKSGEVIAEYVGSGPPKGTGLHRYFFLLFKQPSKMTFKEPKINKNTVGWRRKFSTRKFFPGSPEAVNVYLAQYDDYVPEVHKQLGFNPPKTD